MEILLPAPTSDLFLDDRLHEAHVGAHRVDLERGLHDAPVELVLLEVTHQQAAGKEVPQRRVVAHMVHHHVEDEAHAPGVEGIGEGVSGHHAGSGHGREA